MVESKKYFGLVPSGWLTFLYLAIFPLGQLIRLSVPLFGFDIPVHPSDILVSLSIPIYIFYNPSYPEFFKHFKNFLIIASFSFLLSFTFVGVPEIFVGFLYFLRLISYLLFFVVTYDFLQKYKNKKGMLFSSLVVVIIFVALLGWVQYFFYPDLRGLTILGWDDHLYRLAGSFLDPGFTSILIVLGFIASFAKFLSNKGKKFLIISLFLLISVAFTYARAGYLALVAGILVLVFLKNKSKKLIFGSLVLLALVVLLLPRPSSEGVKLERMHSVVAKIENYKETLQIIKEYPVFGVGFNNICAIRQDMFNDIGYASHSCGGSDSSLLFLFATTGIVGVSSFLYAGLKTLETLKRGFYKQVFLACLVAVLVNSFFVNSLFYPWVMGYLAILLAMSAES